jgi:alkane 1-monooxygenase
MAWYAFASLAPAVLIALAALFDAPFALLALLSITVAVFFADKLPRRLAVSGRSGRAISLTLAAVHFPLLALVVWALGTAGSMALPDKAMLYVAAGLYLGQVSNSNAHELIHAAGRLPRRIGAAIYVSLLHGHHVSAHLHVHHVHAATAQDPNSAPLGEGFWAYVLRATRGEFIAGLRAENTRRARRQGATSAISHPYTGYLLGSAATVALAALLAGPAGIVAHLALAAYAQLQLLLSDYVQHYGLQRHNRSGGKPEPMGPQHSWNAPNWYSGAMMLNAPRHSDHHMRPARPFPALELDDRQMPTLPHSLPVMAVIALVPPLWRRVMDRRARRWQKPAPAAQSAGASR